MVELQGLQLEQPEFTRRNSEVVAVVVDPVEQNAQVVRDLGLGYRILADPNLTVIDAYGLRHDQGSGQPPIAHPATFLTAPNGGVAGGNGTNNSRLPPRPQTIVAAIDRIDAAPP